VKLDPRRVEAFLARPDPAIDIVLVYGPDTGAVSERVERLGRQVVADLADPFQVTDIGAERLREQPQLLIEEAQALCLMGGRRLVRVRRCDDKACRDAVTQLVELGRPAAFVLLEAGELASSSWLRRTAEAQANMAAMPCYREDDKARRQSLPTVLAELGLGATPEALDLLIASLGDDRAAGRRELEKLALYKGDDAAAVTREDVAAVVGDGSALALDDAVWAAIGGEARRLDNALERLFSEGEAAVRVLRATASTVLLLVRLQARVEAGASPADAVAGARPPVFWALRARVTAALSAHPGDRLTAWLAALQEAETRCKSAGSPDELICRQVLARIGEDAGRRRARA